MCPPSKRCAAWLGPQAFPGMLGILKMPELAGVAGTLEILGVAELAGVRKTLGILEMPEIASDFAKVGNARPPGGRVPGRARFGRLHGRLARLV
eukprot:258679-Chlamydomonas_euryale.AAC.1